MSDKASGYGSSREMARCSSVGRFPSDGLGLGGIADLVAGVDVIAEGDDDDNDDDVVHKAEDEEHDEMISWLSCEKSSSAMAIS